MSDIKARYVGHPDGIDDFRSRSAPKARTRRITLAHGAELPTEIDGLKVPAKFRDSLLEQEDNWTKVKREPAKATARRPRPRPTRRRRRRWPTADSAASGASRRKRRGAPRSRSTSSSSTTARVQPRPDLLRRSRPRAGRTFGPQSRTKKTTRAAGGDVALEVPYKLSGHLFDQMVAGTITPVQQGARPRTCRRSTSARPSRTRARRTSSTSRELRRATRRSRTRGACSRGDVRDGDRRHAHRQPVVAREGRDDPDDHPGGRGARVRVVRGEQRHLGAPGHVAAYGGSRSAA
jgi:hypothetical protein